MQNAWDAYFSYDFYQKSKYKKVNKYTKKINILTYTHEIYLSISIAELKFLRKISKYYISNIFFWN